MKCRFVSATLVVLFIAIVTLVRPTVAGDEEPTSKDINYWMKKKLEHSHSILTGLAMEDFERIRTGAEAMRKLGKVEAFARRKDAEDYRMQLRVFDFANRELVRLAKEENLDGVATAFNQLTLSCLNCHKLLRDGK